MAEAKLGLLSYLIDEFDGTRRDLVFVPVALNYDRVLEDTILVKAGQGGQAAVPGVGAGRRALHAALRVAADARAGAPDGVCRRGLRGAPVACRLAGGRPGRSSRARSPMR
jgi:hypothetical protein